MSIQTASARSEYSPSNVNWLTAIVMGLFRALGIVSDLKVAKVAAPLPAEEAA